MRYVVVLALLLGACGGDDRDFGTDPHVDNHGYGYGYDVQGPRGLRLRHSGLVGGMYADPAAYEKSFDDMQRCTGLTAPMPQVIIVAVGALDHIKGADGRPVDALYRSNPPLILLEANVASFFPHEAIHYLLDMNTGNLDPTHQSPLWECVRVME